MIEVLIRKLPKLAVILICLVAFNFIFTVLGCLVYIYIKYKKDASLQKKRAEQL